MVDCIANSPKRQFSVCVSRNWGFSWDYSQSTSFTSSWFCESRVKKKTHADLTGFGTLGPIYMLVLNLSWNNILCKSELLLGTVTSCGKAAK